MKLHNTHVTIPVYGNRCSFGIFNSKAYSYVETVLANDYEDAIEKSRHNFMANLEFLVVPSFSCTVSITEFSAKDTYCVTAFHLSTKTGGGTTKTKIFEYFNEAENSDEAKRDAFFELKKILNVKAVGYHVDHGMTGPEEEWFTNPSDNGQDLDPKLPDEKDRNIHVGRLAIFGHDICTTKNLAVITHVGHDDAGKIIRIKGAYILKSVKSDSQPWASGYSFSSQPVVSGNSCARDISLASEFGVRVLINMFDNTVTTECVSDSRAFDCRGKRRAWVGRHKETAHILGKRCQRICSTLLNHRSQIPTGTVEQLLSNQ